ncbi:hypothetical protein [Variovorax sp. GB1P17]
MKEQITSTLLDKPKGHLSQATTIEARGRPAGMRDFQGAVAQPYV